MKTDHGCYRRQTTDAIEDRQRMLSKTDRGVLSNGRPRMLFVVPEKADPGAIPTMLICNTSGVKQAQDTTDAQAQDTTDIPTMLYMAQTIYTGGEKANNAFGGGGGRSLQCALTALDATAKTWLSTALSRAACLTNCICRQRDKRGCV